MWKLAIVLCVVVVAAKANGSSWAGALQTSEQNVQRVVNAAISMAEDELVAAQLKIMTLVKDLKHGTDEFIKDVYDDVLSVIDKVAVDISELAKESDGVNITECIAMADKFYDIANAAMLSPKACIDEKLKNDFKNIDSINEDSNRVLIELAEARKRVQHCANDIEGINLTVTVSPCFDDASANATWASIRAVAKLVARVTRLKFSLANRQTSLVLCSVNTEFGAFYRESSTIVDKTKECIEKKFAESRN